MGLTAAWVGGLVPQPGLSRRLAVLTLVQALGTGSFLAVSAVYFVTIVHLPATQVGLGLSVAGLVGFLASVPAGTLADRFGAKRPLTAHYAALAVLFPLYTAVSTLPLFLVLACLIGLVEVAGSPLRSALTFSLIDGPTAVTVRAQMRTSFNIGLAAGTLLAGGALANGSRAAFTTVLVGNGIAQAACAVLTASLPTRRPAVRMNRPGLAPVAPQRSVWRDGRFLAVIVCCGVLEMFDSVWAIAVPLWIVRHTTAPPWATAVVLFTGSTLVVALQVAAATRARTIRTAGIALRHSGVLLAAACLVFACSSLGPPILATSVLLLGAGVLALGEITQSAGAWTLSYALPPPGRQGQYQGVFGLARGLQQTLGPIVVTATTITLAGTGWILLAALFLLAGLAGWLATREPGRSTAVD